MDEIEITNLPAMTEPEARAATDRIRSHAIDLAQEVSALKAREGWRAMGYRSFHEWGEDQATYSRSYLARLAEMGRVIHAIEIGEAGDNVVPNGTPVPLPNEAQARELARHDDPKVICSVWVRSIENHAGKPTAQDVADEMAPYVPPKPDRPKKPTSDASDATRPQGVDNPGENEDCPAPDATRAEDEPASIADETKADENPEVRTIPEPTDANGWASLAHRAGSKAVALKASHEGATMLRDLSNLIDGYLPKSNAATKKPQTSASNVQPMADPYQQAKCRHDWQRENDYRRTCKRCAMTHKKIARTGEWVPG